MAASETITLEKMEAWARQQATQLTDPRMLQPAMKTLQMIAHAGQQDHFVQGVGPDGTAWPPPKLRKGLPLRDKGTLKASAQVVIVDGGLRAQNNNVAAALHQFGGIVRPKMAKALAIPMTPAAARVDTPRAFGGALHIRKKKGKKRAGLYDEKGKLQYLLVDKVVVPKRMHVGFSAKTLERMGETLTDMVGRVITQNSLAGG